MSSAKEERNQHSDQPQLTNGITKMQCAELLQLIIDGEASDEQKLLFEAHLENCINCLHNYEVEQQLKFILKTKVKLIQAPEDLVLSIKNGIRKL
jgi:anti-sigma factor (TIGR02949 family)